jgi:hypothetical protein
MTDEGPCYWVEYDLCSACAAPSEPPIGAGPAGAVAATKPVSIEEFTEKMMSHANESYTLEIYGWQVGILHGMVALAASHPQVKQMNQATLGTIKAIRTMCLEVMRTWGIDQETLDYLDKAREEVNHEPGPSSIISPPEPGPSHGD